MDARIILGIAIVLGTCAQIILKIGANQLGELPPMKEMVVQIPKIISNPLIITGLMMQGSAAFFWISAINKLELSYAYPMMAASYVAVVVLGWLIFAENMNLIKILALLMIVAGVSLLNVKMAN